ncbi:hypothetical protein BT96DRAFT_922495 [Gymnopus androsaceus JB14]|uniref:Uncharacterized protein n=1 Tax=Gymnopus androsaceus JB14 TaxID=1447944 RepID=A0A6A4HE50_9AGAR|nr:hypothetical protein BT96DRAFT_922495 [Gymnopus androsaceus JB14]
MDQPHTPDTDNFSSRLLTNVIKVASNIPFVSSLVQRTSKPTHRVAPYSVANTPNLSHVSENGLSTTHSSSSFLSRPSSRSSSISSFSRSQSPPDRAQSAHSGQRPPQSIHLHQPIFISTAAAEQQDENHNNGMTSDKIPKPPGEAGRPSRGGYSLKNILTVKHKWSCKDHDNVSKFIKKLVLEHLDYRLPLTGQSPVKIGIVRDEAVAKFRFLDRYEDNWAVYDFIRSHLKYWKTKNTYGYGSVVRVSDRFASLAASSSTAGNISRPSSPIHASSDRLRSESPHPNPLRTLDSTSLLDLATSKIARPSGDLGRANHGGYSLETCLVGVHNWSNEDYNAVMGFIKELVAERLDCRLPWTTHIQYSPNEIDSIRIEATAKFDFLNAYDNNWVVDDFIRIQLKYQKAILRRKATGKSRSVS